MTCGEGRWVGRFRVPDEVWQTSILLEAYLQTWRKWMRWWWMPATQYKKWYEKREHSGQETIETNLWINSPRIKPYITFSNGRPISHVQIDAVVSAIQLFDRKRVNCVSRWGALTSLPSKHLDEQLCRWKFLLIGATLQKSFIFLSRVSAKSDFRVLFNVFDPLIRGNEWCWV